MLRPPVLIVQALLLLGTAFGASKAAESPTRAAAAVAVDPATAPPPTSSRSTEIVRSDDGLFYVTGLVNGRPVRFLVDTGASVVMLTRADAERVGAILGHESFDASVNTANGAAAMAWTRLRRVSVVGREIATVDAAVPESGLPVSLLGQNVLSRLGPVTLDGDRLSLTGSAAKADDTTEL